jgi:hypothetical protein
LAKDVAETIATHVEANVLSARSAAKAAHGAYTSYFVVLSAFLFIANNVVRSRDVFELLLGYCIVRVCIRVILTRKSPVCLCDVFDGCVFRHAKYCVIVLLVPFALT